MAQSFNGVVAKYMAKLKLNIFSIALYNYYLGAILIILFSIFSIVFFGFWPIKHINSSTKEEIKARNLNINKNNELIIKYQGIKKIQIDINEYMERVNADKKIFTNFKQEDLFVIPQVFEEKFSKLDIQLKKNNSKKLTQGSISELAFGLKYKQEGINDKPCWESLQFFDQSLPGFIIVEEYNVNKDKDKIVCNIILTWTFLTD